MDTGTDATTGPDDTIASSASTIPSTPQPIMDSHGKFCIVCTACEALLTTLKG